MRIDTSPKGMILVATSSGKQVLRGMARLIHRSAWNRNSQKFASRMLHRAARVEVKNGLFIRSAIKPSNFHTLRRLHSMDF